MPFHRRRRRLLTRVLQSGLCLCCLAALPVACRRGGAAAGPAAPAGVTVRVDAHRERQRLEGFGASVAFYQNWLVSHPNKEQIYQALFGGLKLDILRLQNAYRPGSGPNFARDEADITRGAAQSLGRPVTILMSSWSPPAALKSNRSEKEGGTLARENGDFAYSKFARHWRDSLIAYEAAGIRPTYISIQNEPDFKAEWESCLFGPSETGGQAGYGRALDAVYNAVQTLPQPPRLVGPETLGIDGGNPQRYLPPSNAVRLGKVHAVAHHLYSGGTHQDPDTFVPKLQAIRDAYPEKSRWMTEFGRSDGFQTAWLIHNSLVEEEASAYIYWAGVWPGDDALITIDNPWKRDAWANADGFRLNDRYWALKHYAYFTAPGYRRVAVEGGPEEVKVSAFLSPDRAWLVVVALNTSESHPADVTLDLKGFPRGPASAVHQTVFPPSGGGVEAPFQELGPLGTDNRIVLPPRAAVTIAVGSPGALPTATPDGTIRR